MSTKKPTQQQFLDRCISTHGTKFDYSMAKYVNSITKVTIKCNTCDHVWQVTPNNFLNNHTKSGCPECKRIKQIGRDVKSTSEIISEIKLAHGNRLLYDRLVYVNSNIKVVVGCKVHGYFEKWPNDLKNGSGCPRCSGNKVIPEEFLNEMSNKHTNFDFSKFVYISAKTKSTVICSIHGEFLQTPSGLKNAKPNYGCAKCSAKLQLSTRIANGTIRNPKDISEYEKYRKMVWKISNQQFIEHYYKINPTNIKRGPKYHLDHKFSIQKGWQDNISAEIIGGWKNLQLLPAKQNQKKSNKCSVFLEDIL
jgi:Zn finger protein HypA/HybF involved in hydrogenase expression